MKIKKMAGALALSAALAMGTVPAFAAGVTSTDAENDANAFSDSGSTEVKAKIDNVNPNVRATVPLKVTVVFAGDGYSDILGPDSSAYQIKNIGDGDIYVRNAEITGVHKTFTTAPFTKDDAEGGDVDDNTLMFSYTTGANDTFLTVTHSLKDAIQTSSSPDKLIYGATAKKFSAEQIAPGGSLPITLAGRAYTKGLTNDNMTDTICSIKYTISDKAAD